MGLRKNFVEYQVAGFAQVEHWRRNRVLESAAVCELRGALRERRGRLYSRSSYKNSESLMSRCYSFGAITIARTSAH